MNNLKLTLVAGLLSIAATASAQFANTGNSAKETSNIENYGRITISYNPNNFDILGHDQSLYGISLGYTKGIGISKNYPIFVEVGARLNYSFKTQDLFENDGDLFEDEYFEDHLKISKEEAIDQFFNKHHLTLSYMNIAVPVSLAYKFQVKDKIAITPFAGVVLKCNLLAEETYDVELTKLAEESIYKEYLVEYLEDYKNDINYFDEENVGKDFVWNRFQVGWNIGVGVDFNRCYVGVSYGSDFTDLGKLVKSSNWAISLGYNF
ncbi:MAG: outer membrane beta-barrel protein [Muribaculaceae bacterium]|nr:outer membrane beta-barrel protein [Muribaculaceae bacterium]